MSANKSDPPKPSELRRAVWLFAGMAAVILLIGPSDLLSLAWWQAQTPKDHMMLAIPASIGLSLGLLCSWDIWHLTVRRNPLWKDVLTVIAALTLLASMIFLRESRLWVWSFVAADALVVTLASTIVAVSLITERQKRVRVYLASRTLVFIHERKDD